MSSGKPSKSQGISAGVHTSDSPSLTKEIYDSISFSGGGLNTPFHLGVAKWLQKHKIQFREVYATSGGSAVGALFVAGIKAEEIEKYCESRLPLGLLDGCEFVEEALKKFLPSDSHKELSGRLFITLSRVTSLGFIKKEVSKFASKKEAIRYIVASCFIPITTLARFKPLRIHGKFYYDGGFVDYCPVKDPKLFAKGEEKTVKVLSLSRNSPMRSSLDLEGFRKLVKLGESHAEKLFGKKRKS